jgi:hypothetical protein
VNRRIEKSERCDVCIEGSGSCGLLIQQACFTNTVNAIVPCALGVDKRNVFERDRHETVCRYRSAHVQHHGWE